MAFNISPSKHILTFDIEHWYEGLRYRGLSGWQCSPPYDDQVLRELLDVLASYRQQSTMFVTGKFAKEFPHLIKRAAEDGHEIASHSFSHDVLSQLGNLEAFRHDLVESIKILEDLSGKKVIGYRAPKWSIRDLDFLETLSVLKDAGLYYDSSVMPKWKTDSIYPTEIKLKRGDRIWEIPAMTKKILWKKIPIGGGFAFRLLPIWATINALLKRQSLKQPGMIYLHPYDLNPTSPKGKLSSPYLYALRGYGTKTAFEKLKALMKNFKFHSIKDLLNSHT